VRGLEDSAARPTGLSIGLRDYLGAEMDLNTAHESKDTNTIEMTRILLVNQANGAVYDLTSTEARAALRRAGGKNSALAGVENSKNC
jgi:hypothetical protein